MRCVSVYIYIWIICDDLHLGPSDNLSFFFYTFVARWLDSSGSRHPHLIPGLDKLAAVTRSNGERGFLGKCGLLPWLKNAIPENRAIYFKGILKGQCWLIFFFLRLHFWFGRHFARRIWLSSWRRFSWEWGNATLNGHSWDFFMIIP